jgi:hypothetical protein
VNANDLAVILHVIASYHPTASVEYDHQYGINVWMGRPGTPSITTRKCKEIEEILRSMNAKVHYHEVLGCFFFDDLEDKRRR